MPFDAVPDLPPSMISFAALSASPGPSPSNSTVTMNLSSRVSSQPFIDLIWAPVTDSDLGGYNVYRHEKGGVAVKVNSEPIKMPAFRDLQVVSGKRYFYSVSAVDLRGNESARSEEADESVP